MAQSTNEDPAGVSRGAENEHSAHSNGDAHNNEGTHNSSNGGAQDTSTSAPFEPSAGKTGNGEGSSGGAHGPEKENGKGNEQEPPPSGNDGAELGYSWHLIWHGEEESILVRKWLVYDLLPETGVALISGQWGTYKTFVADDLAAAAMTGTDFINREVMRRGGVVFLACENHEEVYIRLTAAFRKHGGTGNAPFVWVKGCPRLLDRNAGKILTAMVKHASIKMMQQFGLPVALVIIDTAGRAAGLSKVGELNDDAVAKIIIAALAQASIATGALFVGVAHFGKDVEIGTKGSTGFEDDADAVLALLGKRGLNGVVDKPALCVRKRKNGPNGEEFPFQTEKVFVGSESTLTIRWTEPAEAQTAAEPKPGEPLSAQAMLENALTEALNQHSTEIKPNGTDAVRAVQKDKVRFLFKTAYQAEHVGADADAERQAWRRALKQAKATLVMEGMVDGTPYLWWLFSPV
jgi:hypothetical protein